MKKSLNSTDTSILNLTKSVIAELQTPSNLLIREKHFIPFINERDGIGKLRKNTKPIELEDKTEIRPKKISHLVLKNHLKLISKKNRLASGPPIGFYYQPEL